MLYPTLWLYGIVYMATLHILSQLLYSAGTRTIRTCLQCAFNASLSSVRGAVEWGYAIIVNNFAYLDLSRNFKKILQPIAHYYTVAAILSNCRTCVYGNQISNNFDVKPPTLETYLSNTEQQ